MTAKVMKYVDRQGFQTLHSGGMECETGMSRLSSSVCTVETVGRIDEIDRDEWNRLFADPLEDYGYFKTVEEAGLEGFSFRYVIFRFGQRLAAIAPLFITRLAFHTTAQGVSKKILFALWRIFPRLFSMRVLFCGSPVTEEGQIGIDREAISEWALLDRLAAAMIRVAKKEKCSVLLFKDFSLEQFPSLGQLQKQGWIREASYPTAYVDIRWDSLDGYFKSLSRVTRKSFKRKLKRAQQQDFPLRTEVRDSCQPYLDRIYELYLNVYHRSELRFECLTKDFFRDFCRNSNGSARLFLYWVGSKLAAFNLCLEDRERLLDKYMGLDYRFVKAYSLYFLSWCNNIQHCIDQKIPVYQAGQAEYDTKVHLGARFKPLVACLRHRVAFFNFFLRVLAKLLKPENFDSTLKELHDEPF